MGTGKVVLGVVAGAAAGALLGILFAPEKGSVTRRNIALKSDEYTQNLKGKFNDFVDTITEKFEKVKAEVITAAEQGKDYAQDEVKHAKTNSMS